MCIRDRNRDLICRAGIVYTLTQLKDINYVSFSISGEPMLDTDGTAIGAQKKENQNRAILLLHVRAKEKPLS